MASIDERVVEMKFRREDFLKGTQETLSALGRLEEGLLGAGGIGEAVNGLARRFSTVGTVGIGALFALGGAAVNAGAKLMNNVIDPIFTGGKKRALNLEQANFQLMGILKNSDDVAAVMENVSYAVDGTAYGLDSAAIAAAQFAASGMRAGDDMANALRGISGVAAMAGSSYEDVSSVFTKVAGQGRLMGDDLNRLASRGINAAASMVDYYKATGKFADITEAELRDMVSKGQVSFADFADAMNSAFGEHATAANETFTGSLSNIKAALARIGAPAFTIEHEKMRRVFNALRPVVNAFQKSLGPVYETYERLYAIPMAEAFERWGKKLESVDFKPLAKTMSQLLVIGSTLKNVIGSWVKPISDAFSVIFADAPSGSWMESVGNFLDGFNRDLGGLAATEEQADSVRETFIKVFEAVKGFTDFVSGAFEFIKPIVKSLWDTFLEGIDFVVAAFDEYLRPYIEEAFEYLFGLESPLRQFWDTFRADVEESGSVLETLGTYFRDLYDKYVAPAIKSLENFKDVLISIKDEGFTGLREKIKEAFAPLEDLWVWIGSVKERMKEFFIGVENPLGGIKAEFPSVGEWIKTLVIWIIDGFKEAEPVLGEMFTSISDFFRNLGTMIGDFMSNVTLEDAALIKEIIGEIVLGIMLFKTIQSIKGVSDSISGFFGTLSGTLTEFNNRAKQATKGNTFLKIAGGLLIIAGALWLMSTIPADKLLTSAGVLGILGGVIIGFMFALDKVDGATLAKAGFGLGLFSSALFGLAVTMVLLGMIPYETLEQGMITLGLLMAAMVIAGAVLGKWATDMPATAFGLGLLAGALTLLIIPIRQLGEMPYDVLEQGMGALGLMLGALVIAAVVLGQAAPNMIQAGIGLAVIAGALTLMIIPIERLGEMPYEQMNQGLLAVALALGILLAAAIIMQPLGAGAAGVVALSAALVILAFGIKTLASVPFGAAALGLTALAIALGILLGASAIAMLILPGILGLAGLMLAFGVAAILVGAAAILFAAGAVILSLALPDLAANLLIFAMVAPEIAKATPYMIAMGLGLLVFGAGALVAGVGAIALGAGLLALGLGLALVQTFAPGGAVALLEFVDAIMPLIWKLPQIGLISVGIAALGAAMLVLGAGLLLAGAGGIMLGAGAIAAGIGLAILIGLMALTTPLIDRIVVAFEKLGPLAPGIDAFAMATIRAAVGLGAFVGEARSAADLANRLVTVFSALAVAFTRVASASVSASTMIASAMSSMVNSTSNAATGIKTYTISILTSFQNLGRGIGTAAPQVAGAVTAMMLSIVTAITVGSVSMQTSFTAIITQFTNFGKKIKEQGDAASKNTNLAMRDIVKELENAARSIPIEIDKIVKAFGKIATGIDQNRSGAITAVQKITYGLRVALIDSVGPLGSLASGVGTAIVNGMISGMRGGSARLNTQARTMAKSALNAAKNELGVKSPSRKAYEMMSFFVDGAVNGIRDGVPRSDRASRNMAMSMMDSVSRTIDEMSGDFDLLDINPTITPVLDLDQVARQASGLQGLFGARIDPSFNRGQANAVASLEEAFGGYKSTRTETLVKKVEFNQELHSPKELSASEIYRNTRNLISVADRVEG
jgi:tape measure domain-containing protein